MSASDDVSIDGKMEAPKGGSFGLERSATEWKSGKIRIYMAFGRYFTDHSRRLLDRGGGGRICDEIKKG
jgi:hypothetical protein